MIHSMDELLPLIERTRQVAEHAFGSPRLFLERYLSNASHIEVQLIGDQHGNLVHLYERDCSIQRRNQKLIEETPATKLTPKLRNKLHKLALKLGRQIGYTNAGTVEFLVSPDEEIYFLEMNTRLQVEHGVTELITGMDLVELQIRAALGQRLPISQADVIPNGHAVEARIYPEDPENFMPSMGTVTDFHLPTGDAVRVDSALCSGYEVTLHYEPLLAKVMCWGEDRAKALQGIMRALLEFRVEGVETNIPLLREIVVQKQFQCGTHHTGSLPQWLQDRFQPSQHGKNNAGKDRMSAQKTPRRQPGKSGGPGGSHRHGDGCRRIFGPSRPRQGDQRLARRRPTRPIPCPVHQQGRLAIAVFRIQVSGQWYTVEVGDLTTSPVEVTVDGETFQIEIEPVAVEPPTPRPTTRRARSAPRLVPPPSPRGPAAGFPEGAVISPMPGRVISIMVRPGASVSAGDELCVLEAMKMEQSIRAARDGVVKAIHVQPMDSVSANDLLMELE